jgi:DNA-binding CsgD family transcriptional regulator
VLKDQDLRGVLEVLEAGRSSEPAEGLPHEVLELARSLIPCDVVSFTEFDPVGGTVYVDEMAPEGLSTPDSWDDETFWRAYFHDRHCSYSDRTGDHRTITTTSDFYTSSQWHDSPMYAEFFKQFRIEHEAMVCLSAPPGRNRRLLFDRSGGVDFSDRERLLLSLLRPHLDELCRDLEHRRLQPPQLTPSQWKVLRLVARGHSNAEIARQLFVSKDTVRKHLENIFARLGVSSRTEAVARTFPSSEY